MDAMGVLLWGEFQIDNLQSIAILAIMGPAH